MAIFTYDFKFKFGTLFDPETGLYIRNGIGEVGEDPFMASFPHLIDVGIMGHCSHGKSGLCAKAGVQCYQSGLLVEEPNMSLDNYKRIIDESQGKVFQVALGGRGDPDQHEHFEEILKYTREHNIVPNFTSSGLGFDDRVVGLSRDFCGAVAVSWYRHEHTFRAIDMLIKGGVKTNVHYVLGNNSIDEAIERLEANSFPEGINAVIFLLHKPVGLGRQENVLSPADSRVRRFFEVVAQKDHSFKIGFDSCSIPGLINFSGMSMGALYTYTDSCEGARFSMYISPDMKAMPCSFDQDGRWAYDISSSSIEEAWNSKAFEDFRDRLRNACLGCNERIGCMGGCPIRPEIVLCKRKERSA